MARNAKRTSNNMTMFLAGSTVSSGFFGGIDLFLKAPLVYTASGTLTLYSSGRLEPTGITNMNLYIAGVMPSVGGGFPLYTQGNGAEQGITLFVRGKFTDSGFPLIGGSGISGVMNLFITGTGTNPPDPTGALGSISNSHWLFIKGEITGPTGDITLYTQGASPNINTIDLFVNGVSGLINNNITLYTSGLGYINSGNTIDLFTRGF